jgi:hypothetical protein
MFIQGVGASMRTYYRPTVHEFVISVCFFTYLSFVHNCDYVTVTDSLHFLLIFICVMCMKNVELEKKGPIT